MWWRILVVVPVVQLWRTVAVAVAVVAVAVVAAEVVAADVDVAVADSATHHNYTNYTNHTNYSSPLKILYIVTSGGKSYGGASQHRFRNVLQPVVLDTTSSLMRNYPHWTVNVYLVLGYTITNATQSTLQQQLYKIHPSIQLTVWQDAMPLGYVCPQWTSSDHDDPIGRGGGSCLGLGPDPLDDRTPRTPPHPARLGQGKAQLARQHRYVVKDQLPYYDFFLAFEDDMRIQNHHVEYHQHWRQRLQSWITRAKQYDDDQQQQQASSKGGGGSSGSSSSSSSTTTSGTTTSGTSTSTFQSMVWNPLLLLASTSSSSSSTFRRTQSHLREEKDRYWHRLSLSAAQLETFCPGWIRVEVWQQQDQDENGSSSGPGVDDTNDSIKNINTSWAEHILDPHRCCGQEEEDDGGTSRTQTHKRSSKTVRANDLVIWETSLLGFGVRRIPERPGNHNHNHTPRDDNDDGDNPWVALLPSAGLQQELPQYWAGNGIHPRPDRPRNTDPRYISQSAGWMASQREIWEWHTHHCTGGFLPPFDAPHYQQDGFWRNTVEYWSGGIQLFGKTCQLQRFISLEHNGNDFDRHLLYHTSNNKHIRKAKQGKLVRATTLLAQLQWVQTQAQAEREREKRQQGQAQ